MRLYKIVRMGGDHGVSVFPPEDAELVPPEQLMAEPITDLVNWVKAYGYTEHQAYHIVMAWANHAKYDLNQSARGVRVFCEMAIKQLPSPIPPVPFPWWYLAAFVAALAAAALGLALWVYFDVEYSLTFSGHEWAYVMLYEENLWQGEILYVTEGQIGVYERGGDFGPVLQQHLRNEHYIGRPLDVFLFHGQLVLRGRRLLFWHEYRWQYWDVYFCGVLTHIGPNRYKLRERGEDPYKPVGSWWRPGGFWGTPEYEGCWQEFWWL